jgi:glycosyltransferase involved in cell wall biosynthesis
MRIAFLTSEFVSDFSDGGGLANYLNRIGQLLVDGGHEVEVFTVSGSEPRVVTHEGMRVERVRPVSMQRLWRTTNRLFAVVRLRYPGSLYLQARYLAAAMERRHRIAPFDLVQSSDYMAVGLSVRRAKRRIHLLRCSSAADLYNEIDGRNSRSDRWRAELEFTSMRRADLVYAPSRFIAEHLKKRVGVPVEVVRPPFTLEKMPQADLPCGLPGRFLVHFGHLNKRKGTYWLAEALPRAFATEPNLRMVWVGRASCSELSRVLSGLGCHRSKVQVMYPLPKRELYAVLRRAEAAVLPSLVDNLPNTVMESLMLGIPVIGTRGASIDELVEHNVTGELVEPNDVEGLAAALVRVWNGRSRASKGFSWKGHALENMHASTAVDNLLRLAREGKN